MKPKLALILWAVFIGGNALLLLADALFPAPMVFDALFLLFLLFIGMALSIVHRHFMAQWRAVFLFIALYALARWFAVYSQQHQWSFLEITAMALALYAMFSLWGALLALSVARDVSVAYLVIFAIIAPIALRMALLQSGGLLALLQANAASGSAQSFSIMEPIVLGLSCMPGLAFFTFILHFLWLWFKELNRAPLVMKTES